MTFSATGTMLRHELRAIVTAIAALDDSEADAQRSVLRWIDSGEELDRESGAAPARHLAVYFTLVDPADPTVLQIHHVKADAWMFPGVHLASPVSRTSLSATARRDEAAARVRGLRLGY
jgi:hypothetical protein